jgi:two-component system KDP operon response regulator KdpE
MTARDDRPTILVVEDDPTNLQLLRAVLARAPEPELRNLRIVETGTLAEARAALARERCELVLLDVRLPDGNGLDLARSIRRSELRQRPQVLILSASVLPMERDAAIAAGGDRFLAKPYLPADLRSACADLLRRATELEEALITA